MLVCGWWSKRIPLFCLWFKRLPLWRLKAKLSKEAPKITQTTEKWVFHLQLSDKYTILDIPWGQKGFCKIRTNCIRTCVTNLTLFASKTTIWMCRGASLGEREEGIFNPTVQFSVLNSGFSPWGLNHWVPYAYLLFKIYSWNSDWRKALAGRILSGAEK